MLKRVIFLCVPICAYICTVDGLPRGEQVVAGDAQFAWKDGSNLVVTTSDKTIINYRSFNIDELESVQFIQPNASSCALNRVTGGESTSILGAMTANGRIFLVNPYGIYFGAKAVVNSGSLVASVLDIHDSDFLNEQYRFTYHQGSLEGSIVNEGLLSADGSGSVVLLSPHIRNSGFIKAQAGSVVLAGAEMVTLDFAGDGTIHFALEGDLQNALVEQLGTIQAPGSDVSIHAKTASQAIRTVVNTEGLASASKIVKTGGTIRLSSAQKTEGRHIDIKADQVNLSGSTVAQGNLTVSAEEIIKIRDQKEAPVIAHAYKEMKISGGTIDILALDNPHTSIASGGSMTFVSDQPISADGHFTSGGDFSLITRQGAPADFKSLFDPIISATGAVTFGAYTGVSLKVESTGNITTTGAISITGPDLTASLSDTDGATLRASSALILRSGLAVLQGFGLPVPPNEVAGGATFTTGAGASGITLGAGISTTSGPMTVILEGNVLLGANTTISSSGGPVTIIGSVNSSGIARSFTVTAGAGAVSISGAIGTTLPVLSALTVSGSTVTLANIGLPGTGGVTGITSITGTSGITFTGNNYRAATQTYNGGGTTFTMNNGATTSFISSANNIQFSSGTISLGTNTNLSVSTANGLILLSNITSTSVPKLTVSLNGGTGAVTVGSIGTALGQFSSVILGGGVGGAITTTGNIFSDAVTFNPGPLSTINLGGNISTTSTPLAFSRPVSITANVTLDTSASGGGAITFSNTINANASNRILTLNAGTGAISFNNTVGAVTRLGRLIATTTGVITAANTIGTSGMGVGLPSLTLTGTTINVANNISSSINGNITFSGNVVRGTNNATTISTAGGGDITFNGLINGNSATRNLTVTSTGNVNFNGAIGSIQPLATLTVSGVNITQNANITTIGTQTYTASGVTSIGGNITTANSNVTYNGIGATQLIASHTIDTGVGAITFSNTLDGDGVLPRDLTLLTTTGSINFNAAVGSVFPLGVLTATASGAGVINQTNTVNASGGVFYSVNAGAGLVNLGGDVTTSDNPISITANVSLSANNTSLTSKNAIGGNIFISGTINGSIAARSLSLTAGTGTVTFGDAIGATTPLNTLTANAIGGVIDIDSTVSTTNDISFIAASINVSNDITNTIAGDIIFTGNVVRKTNDLTTISTANGNISFLSGGGGSGKIDSDISPRDLTLTAGGSNTITFAGAIGSTQPLGRIFATATTINQESSVVTDLSGLGTVTYNGLTNLGGDITTNNSHILFSGNVVRDSTGVATLASTNGNVTFTGTLDGDGIALTPGVNINAGSGNIHFDGAVGSVNPLGSLSATTTTGNIVQNSTVNTSGDVTYAGDMDIQGNITTANGNILLTGSSIQLSADITFDVSAGNKDVTVNGPINGDISGRGLTVVAGTGTVTFNGPIGNVMPIGALLVTGGVINQNSSVMTTGSTIGIVAYNGLTNLGGNITTDNSAIIFGGNVIRTLIDDVTINSNGANILFGRALDGNVSTRNLTIFAGAGNVQFDGGIGFTEPLCVLYIQGHSITTTGGVVAGCRVIYNTF